MKTTTAPKPQFRDVTFKGATYKESQDRFIDWLNKTRSKTIILVDKGFDLHTIDIHKSEEILHCNANASIYNGQFVDLKKLKTKSPLIINGEEYRNLVPEKIVNHKKK